MTDPSGLPSADSLARQMVNAKRHASKAVPAVVDLAAAITNVAIFDTIRGSSTLTLHLVDPDWELLDSGFFDADQDGRLDVIEVNYPDGTDLWWRCTQANPSDTTGVPMIDMVFMERTAAYLLDHRGPVKVSRAKKTRAEFLLMLCGQVKAGGGIQFISQDLHKKSPFAPDTPAQKKAADRKAAKGQGIHVGDPTVKVKGQPATSAQVGLLERVLDVATALSAGPKAQLALVEIVIVETDVSNPPCKNDGFGNYSVGIVQAGGGKTPASCPAYGQDVEKCVTFVLQGGAPWVGHGGLLALEASSMTPGQMAQAVQSSAFPDAYTKQEGDATAIITAYGLGGGGSNVAKATYRPQFNFEVGDINNPRETYWDAMNRLADQVKWPMFIDGPRVYFDPETTLITAKPAAVITRGDPSVISFTATWDVRNIATDCILTVICDPLEFRAGETLLLAGFGPLSTGSTVKLPGRWLISQTDRNETDIFSTLTLKQPEKPQPEPVNALRTATGSPGASTDLFTVCQAISAQNRAYVYGGGHGGTLASIGPKDGLDCSSSVALALSMAGMFLGTSAIVSGEFARTWGLPGRGVDFTVWANDSHVFIQSEGTGAHWRFDTGGGPPSGPHVRNSWRTDLSGRTPRHWPSR